MSPRPLMVAVLLAASLGCSSALPATASDDGFLYVAGIYDQRYSDTIFTADALKPFGSATSSIRPYTDVMINLDSQTLSETIPSILTDNYALGALGAQYENGKGLRAFAQVGITARIGSEAAHEPGADVRSGVELYHGWGGLLENRPMYASFFGNATYISRDRDAVSFDQIEGGRSFHAGHAGALDLYAHAVLTLDTSGFYYSNIAEGAVGLRVRSIHSTGIGISVEKSLGTYLRGLARPAGIYASYRNFHANVNYAVPF
jgi:hypothetical protein